MANHYSKSTAKRIVRRTWYKNARLARKAGNFDLARFAIRRAMANKG